MLRIVDVEWLKDKELDLTFSDGYKGEVNLAPWFEQKPFNEVANFLKFSLTGTGSLRWGNCELGAEELRQSAQGLRAHPSIQSIEYVLKQAAWESLQEGRPDIFQSAIRGYVEKYGHGLVIKKAGIKSRTSAYRSLNADTTPNFRTLVQLGNAIIHLASEEEKRAE